MQYGTLALVALALVNSVSLRGSGGQKFKGGEIYLTLKISLPSVKLELFITICITASANLAAY